MRAFGTSTLAFVFIALGCAALATPAHALLVDFEDSVPASPTTSTSSHGFDFSGTGSFGVGPGFASHCLNGTRLLCDQFGTPNVIKMTQSGGGSFELRALGLQEGIDIGSAAAQVIRVTGFFTAGGAIVSDFDLDDDWTTFQTFATPGFVGLSSVTIEPLGGRLFMGLDDLQVEAIPEPGSLTLLGFALAALTGVRRRSTRS